MAAAHNAFLDISKNGVVRVGISDRVHAHFDATADLPTILSAVALMSGHTRTLSMEKRLDVVRMRLPTQDDITDVLDRGGAEIWNPGA